MILAHVAFQTAERVFAYITESPVKSVSLVGTFNNWDKGAAPMTLGADGRTWTKSLSLPYGKHQYKFVLDGERWIVDPKGKTVDDGNGHQNSELLIVPADYAKPADPRDGEIAPSGLRHRPSLPDVNVDRGQIVVRLRVRANDVGAVDLVSSAGPNVRTARVASDELYDTYEARLKLAPVKYSFRLADGRGWRLYGPQGLDNGAQFAFDPKTAPIYRVPAWPEGSVVYQIFPDRFANGDKANDLPGTLPWDAQKLGYASRLGGDVAGVRAHLDYLKDLGVKTVYYTPRLRLPQLPSLRRPLLREDRARPSGRTGTSPTSRSRPARGASAPCSTSPSTTPPPTAPGLWTSARRAPSRNTRISTSPRRSPSRSRKTPTTSRGSAFRRCRS